MCFCLPSATATSYGSPNGSPKGSPKGSFFYRRNFARNKNMTDRAVPVKGRVAQAWLLFCLLGFGVAVPGAARTCDICHASSDLPLHFQHSSAGLSCSDCHGPSSAHLAKAASPVERDFGNADATSKNQACLGCHDTAQRLHWSASAHQQADISCTDCHQTHASSDPMLAKTSGQQICLDCHTAVQADLQQRSRHPIAELKTSCMDCHSSHGSLADQGELRQASARAQCLGCHQEKQGPFLFEHEPVSDDCLLCHKPHGASQPALLVSRPPFLCQTCHMPSDHPGQLADGRRLALASSNLLGNSCLNCHGAIHGSNHPAGARLLK